MEHDLAIGKERKKKEILSFASAWMSLEGIMLSEISQTEEDKYCLVSPICGVLTKFTETA